MPGVFLKYASSVVRKLGGGLSVEGSTELIEASVISTPHLVSGMISLLAMGNGSMTMLPFREVKYVKLLPSRTTLGSREHRRNFSMKMVRLLEARPRTATTPDFRTVGSRIQNRCSDAKLATYSSPRSTNRRKSSARPSGSVGRTVVSCRIRRRSSRTAKPT
jgi:hypothetical protein